MSLITLSFDWPMGVFPDELVPWGVTANLSVWRRHFVQFDERYAKAGGGEDVDFCLRVAKASGLPFGHCRDSVATHPYWPREPGMNGSWLLTQTPHSCAFLAHRAHSTQRLRGKASSAIWLAKRKRSLSNYIGKPQPHDDVSLALPLLQRGTSPVLRLAPASG